jgi:hypothetical protein
MIFADEAGKTGPSCPEPSPAHVPLPLPRRDLAKGMSGPVRPGVAFAVTRVARLPLCDCDEAAGLGPGGPTGRHACFLQRGS